jgi:hypothetical protein
VTPETNQQLGELIVKIANGEVSLAELGGLDAPKLAAILSQAIAQMQVGRDDKAVPILQVLIALDPLNPIFHEYLGLAAERLGDHQRAYTEYTANIFELEKLESPNAVRLCEAYLLRCRLSATRGDMALAAADLEVARKHDHGKDPELRQEVRLLEQAIGGAR